MNEAAILRMLAQMDARQARIEAMLLEITGRKTDAVANDLLQRVAALTSGEWFAVRELWGLVEDLRRAAEATGEPAPEVVQALDDLGLSSTRSLGKWLALQDPALVERTEKTRDGLLWRVVTLAG